MSSNKNKLREKVIRRDKFTDVVDGRKKPSKYAMDVMDRMPYGLPKKYEKVNTDGLLGFGIYDKETGEPVPDQDHYIITATGTLKIWKSRLACYVVVPKNGELIVQYGAGDREVW